MEAGAKIRVRRAVPIDEIDIVVVRIASWREAYRGILPQSYLDAMRKARTVEIPLGTWVVEANRIVAGYCFVTPVSPEAIEIKELYVHPDYWRMGLGRAILDEVVASAKSSGAREIGLWVLEGNARGRAFYEATGFQRKGKEARMFETGGDRQRAVLYVRLL